MRYKEKNGHYPFMKARSSTTAAGNTETKHASPGDAERASAGASSSSVSRSEEQHGAGVEAKQG